jgi:hypothetical protein
MWRNTSFPELGELDDINRFSGGLRRLIQKASFFFRRLTGLSGEKTARGATQKLP